MGNKKRLWMKLCNKCYNFNFHIVNFPFCQVAYHGPLYGVYILFLAAHIMMTLDIAIKS